MHEETMKNPPKQEKHQLDLSSKGVHKYSVMKREKIIQAMMFLHECELLFEK
jgi:hypothetical protein